MKVANAQTKQTFMHAARQGRVMHTLVHFDEEFYEDAKASVPIQRAYRQIKALLKTKSPDIPTAYATMFPHIPFFELYTNDFHAKDDLNDSAVEAPLVQSFIQQRSISVMLISGYAIGECIDAAVKSALEQGIIPILIADATDTVAEPASAAQKDKDYYIHLFESLVDGNVHVAHVDDVQDWVAELYTDDYMHS
jgi:nicotinamidase-related amidase